MLTFAAYITTNEVCTPQASFNHEMKWAEDYVIKIKVSVNKVHHFASWCDGDNEVVNSDLRKFRYILLKEIYVVILSFTDSL